MMNASVIICTYNRSGSLERTLASLARMELRDSADWELLVVDNNSKDDTRVVVDGFTRASGVNCRYIFEKEQGLSHARNRGIREAKGEIIAFTDDDVLLDRHWLKNISLGSEWRRGSCWREDIARMGKILSRVVEGGPAEYPCTSGSRGGED
jgi:glycosyltransferase involved in cell wall biosynthesis